MVPILTHVFSVLPKLETHLPTILASTAFWFAIEYTSGLVSPKISSSYRNHPKKTQVMWNSNVAAFIHAVIICPLAWKMTSNAQLNKDQVWGYSYEAGQVFAFSTGFIWDVIFSAINCPPDFLLHGIGGLALMVCSFRPFVGYYVTRFLLWELSTPFVNAHWFFNKTGRSGSVPMLINAAVLLAVFFSARLVYGSFLSFNFWRSMFTHRAEIPYFLHFIYEGFDVAMTSLNLFWFAKMVQAAGRQLRGERKGAKSGAVNGANSTKARVSGSRAGGIKQKEL